ncbi:serine hydrolase domain-containing protein [Tropicimonas sp. TH_r6]|uniref:serine hydrolase domain-containing protein n=1 Tax=Tropicimonas sp. TH_r6 TaxID=3082085 RepID=UPI0029539B35|nr:serine hydrolase domain-containing protein [Tropicimonas sp. TH_r6]MDV7145379.1 serine hydrolase domain-containing protein [Tropicimonas sp. TH_r6]
MTAQDIHTHWIKASGAEGQDGMPGATFPYWSFTKTAIAICALKLVETGKLSLDARLDGRPYTLRHLLAHSAGLPDYGPLKAYHAAVARRDTPWSREKLLEATQVERMLFKPGDGWSYSNIGYLLVRDLVEEATATTLGRVISDLICKPVGLETVAFWDSLEQSSALHWDAAAGYDPRWVYHGCLVGTASDAARLLHALFAGELLTADILRAMLDRRSLGGALPGRPWTRCGYGLGLMSGAMDGVGQAVGHSGAGPFCVNAVYHFPDLPDPMTVACFTDGFDEGVAEFAAERIAQTQ